MALNTSSISYNKPTSRQTVNYIDEIWLGFDLNKDFDKPVVVGPSFTAYRTDTNNEDAHGVMLSIDGFQDGMVTISAELWMKYGNILTDEAVSTEANKRVKDGFKQLYMNVQDGNTHPLFGLWKALSECVLLRKEADKTADGKKPTRKDGDKEVEIDFNYVFCTRKEAKSRTVKTRISDKDWNFNLRCMSESLKAGYDVTEELKEASKKSSTTTTASDELPE